MTGQYILRHSLGFALQVLPAVSLMLLSFDRGCFRIRASRLWGLVMGLALLLSAAFPAAQFATGSYDLSAAGVGMLEGSRFANLYMCASIALLLLPFIFLVREPALRKLVAFSFALVYGGLQYSLANLLIPYLPLPDGAEVFPPQTFAAFAIVTAVTFPPIALYFRREVRRYLRDMTLRYSVREFVFLLVITVFYLVLNAAFGSLWASLREQLQLNPAYYPILFLLLTAMLCTVYFATIRLAILRQEGMEHALEIAVIRESYDQINQAMRTQRARLHDQRQLLGVLSAHIQSDSRESLQLYVDEITQRLHVTDERFCADRCLNGILQYYASLARARGILFEAEARCDDLSAIRDVDLTVMLGNALENAVRAAAEYTQKHADAQVVIHFAAATSGNLLTVLLDNSCAGVELNPLYRASASADGFLPGEAFKSTTGHGTGLKRIDSLCARYGGAAAYRYDEEEGRFWTRVSVVLGNKRQ